MHIGSTFMDKAMLAREISVTFHSSLQLLRENTVWERVARDPKRVESMLRYYLASLW